MSCDPKLTCGIPVTLEEILKALILKYDGCYYVNVIFTGQPRECTGVEMAVKCTAAETWEELWSQAVVLDDCGLPALNLMYSMKGGGPQ